MDLVTLIKELIALLKQYLTQPKTPPVPSPVEQKPVVPVADDHGVIVSVEPKTPWLDEAKKNTGKKETDPEFQKKMNPFWAKAGLPQFRGLVGSARAWCALFVLASLSVAGYKYTNGNASAISWDNFGQKVDWKVNGIPKGAIVRINHGANCKTSSNNHVAFADGDCSAQDLLKSGAQINLFGGNQSDQVKVSSFPVAHICAVRWPTEEKLPAKIEKSKNCSGASGTNSTK